MCLILGSPIATVAVLAKMFTHVHAVQTKHQDREHDGGTKHTKQNLAFLGERSSHLCVSFLVAVQTSHVNARFRPLGDHFGLGASSLSGDCLRGYFRDDRLLAPVFGVIPDALILIRSLLGHARIISTSLLHLKAH